MTILAAQIDWHPEFDNEPTLTVDLDALPDHSALRYERRGRYLFAQGDGGYVNFLYDDPHNHEGFGGREFHLTLTDGSQVTLTGPWSGNELGATALGFPMSYGCTARVKEVHGGHEHTYHYGIHLSEPVWLDTIRRFCPEADVARVRAGKCYSENCDLVQNSVIGMVASGEAGPVVCSIVKRGMTPAQTYADKRATRFARYVRETHKEERTWGESSEEQQRRLAEHVNQLISDHGLEAFGHVLFDLGNLPPLLPPRPPEPVCSYNPEDESAYD